MKFTALLFEHALLFVPERIPESRRNTMHQLIYNGFLCELYGLIGLIIAQISNDIHYQSMAFKRSAVRSRLSPPKNTRFQLKSSVFLYFSACFVLGIFALDNRWTTGPLNFFFSYCGKEEVMASIRVYLKRKREWAKIHSLFTSNPHDSESPLRFSEAQCQYSAG